MPYSVSLTTRNTLNPVPQLDNFWATKIVESEGGGLLRIYSVKERVRREDRQAVKTRTLETPRMRHPKPYLPSFCRPPARADFTLAS
jgi:hypothetical protein